MAQRQYLFILEHPTLGRRFVGSSSGTPVAGTTDPEHGPTSGRHPEQPGDRVTAGPGQENMFWLQHAQHFLSNIPRSDKAYSDVVPTNTGLFSIVRTLRLSDNPPDTRASFSWSRFFDECAAHLTFLQSEPPLASLFSLVFSAACQVALDDGCNPEIVLSGLRSCLSISRVNTEELRDVELREVCERILRGIKLLADYAESIGPRAYEIPLHVNTNCLQLFLYCTPSCSAYIRQQIHLAYHPTLPIDSERLETPALVYDLLGGRQSKWEYQEICDILRPDTRGVDREIVVDMGRVLELDEDEDAAERFRGGA